MRNVMLTTLFLFACLMLLIAASRLIGSRQPEPEVLTHVFKRADGSDCIQWCLFGVVPISMTGLESVATLDRHAITHNMKKRLVGNIGPDNYAVEFVARDTVISVDDQGLGISLYDNWYTDAQRFSVPDWLHQPVYLAEVIERYAHDGRLQVHTQASGDRISLTYANETARMLFIFQLSNPYRVTPKDRLVFIGVYDRRQEPPLASTVWHKWDGFTSVEHYTPIFTN
jgi:hypothetical protein